MLTSRLKNPTSLQKSTVATIAGLSLLGVLTGCSTAADAVAGSSSAPNPNPTESPRATTATGAPEGSGSGASVYRDGTYDATGSYASPGGKEEIAVTLTLANGVITAVTVTPESTNPNGKRYQGEFAAGISAVVVGVDIDSLKVAKVAGSSLTSAGFNEAVSQIRSDAVA